VAAQQARDQAAEAQAELTGLAERLELAAEPADESLADEEREALQTRIERLARRREQLGPVNPLAQDEYAEALAHVEELEEQRRDLDTALRELQSLITETDRRIREAFEETFAATAANFEELVGQLFPGGRGRLRLVKEEGEPKRVLGGQIRPPTTARRLPSPSRRGGGARGGPPRRRDRDDPGREVDEAPVAALGRREVADRARLPVRDLPRSAVPVLRARRGRGRTRRPQHRPLPHPAAPPRRPGAVRRRHPPEAHDGAADTLYGVSMGDDGISRVISRRLPSEEREQAGAAA
jgi:chromosome segregation protein